MRSHDGNEVCRLSVAMSMMSAGWSGLAQRTTELGPDQTDAAAALGGPSATSRSLAV